MSRRKKLPELDERIWEIWDKTIFPDGRHRGPGGSVEESIETERGLKPLWDQVLDMAYRDSEWLVTTTRWWNAMILGEFERACLEIERCLRHKDPLDRSHAAELPIMLFQSKLMAFGDIGAIENLKSHISSGIYRPAKMAKLIARRMVIWTDLHKPALPFPKELRSLARALAAARKFPKTYLAKCERIRSWAGCFAIAYEVGIAP